MKTKLLKKLRRKVKNDIKYSYIDDLVYLCDSNLEIYLTLKYPEFIKTSSKYLFISVIKTILINQKL